MAWRALTHTGEYAGSSYVTVYFKGNSTYDEQVVVQIKKNGTTVNSISGYIGKNINEGLSVGGLTASTTYTCVWTGETANGSFTFTTAAEGSGGGGSPDDASVGPNRNNGYPTITAGMGPYPIDSKNYVGQPGSQQGITWPSGTGYYWAKINGTGNKLLTNSTSNPYTGTYDASHHGTGDYVSITLEGDVAFDHCSGFLWSVSSLSEDDSNFGTWLRTVNADREWNDAWWPPLHSFSSSSETNDLARLNTYGGSYNTYGVDSSITTDHAPSGAGRGTTTVRIPRPATIESGSGKIYTYYCKQSLRNGSWSGSNNRSIAAISFDVPRLDPLVSTDTDGTGSGNCEIYISNGYDSSTDSYTYDSTPYTSRYIPMDTHLKVVATPGADSIFDGFSDSSISYTQDGNSYYFDFDVTDDISYQAIFWEDTSDKAMYLNEIMTTNKSYRLVDGSAAHGSGTSGRLSKWNTAKTLTDAPVITGSTSTPSSLDNGNITAVNSENGYPNQNSWLYDYSGIYGNPEYVYCDLKATFVSETANDFTVKFQTDGHQTSTYDGGYGKVTYKLSLSDGTTLLEDDGTSETQWSLFSSGRLVNNVPWKRADENSTYGPITHTITKTNTEQTITATFRVDIWSSSGSKFGYTSVSYTFKVPPLGFSAAVGYNGSVRKGRTYVKYNDSWHDAIIWVKVNGTWVKGHYY